MQGCNIYQTEVKPKFSNHVLMPYLILHKPFIVSSPLIDYPVGGGMFSCSQLHPRPLDLDTV